MKLELTFYMSCSTKLFKINGKEADESDFGEKYDHGSNWDESEKEPYTCIDMKFDRFPSKKRILKKYGITEEEYSKICDKLEVGLSKGSCGLCQ